MYKYLILFLSALSLSSCNKEVTDMYDELARRLVLTKSELFFGSEKKMISIGVSGPYEWSVDTTTMKPWCKIEIVDNFQDKSYINISVEQNEATEGRETEFKINSAEDSKTVKITQIGSLPGVYFARDTITVSRDTTVIAIDLYANINFKIETDCDWIKVVDPYVNNDTPLRFSIRPNKSGIEREGTINFTQTDGNFERKLQIIQSNGFVEYDDEGVQVKGNFELTVKAAIASSCEKGLDIDRTYDKSGYTYYKSDWQPINEPIVMEYTISTEQPLSYIIYTPYDGDSKKTFAKTDIYVKATTDADYVLKKSVTFSGILKQTVMLDASIENAEKVKFIVQSVNNPTEFNYLVGACNEMQFFSSGQQYGDIFTDRSYSRLKKGVTLEQILNIDDNFYKNIAEHLYHETYPRFRTHAMSPYDNPVAKNSMGALSLFDNPTGISVSKGQEIAVLADNIKANNIKLCLINPVTGQYTLEYLIIDGANKYRIDEDAMLYVKYHSEVVGAEPINIHFSGGNVNGYYDITKHTPEQGMMFVQNAKATHFDLLGKNVHLIFPVKTLREHVSNLQELVEKYDQIAELEYSFIGFDKYSSRRGKNRVCIISSEKLAPHVNPNKIIIPESKIEDYCTVSKLTGDLLWNLAHDLGHVFTHKAMQLVNTTEANADLFAIYVQTMMDGTSKIKSDSTYYKAFNAYFADLVDYDKGDDNVTKAVLYWQLYLYMTKVMNSPDFFKDLYEQYRLMPYNLMDILCLTTNKTAGINFNDFFDSWGFTKFGAAPPAIKAPVGLKYITDDNYTMYIDPVPPLKVKCTLRNRPISGNVVTEITVPATHKNAVAYEIRIKGSVFLVSTSKVIHIDPKYVTNAMEIVAIGAKGEEIKLDR